MSEYNVRREAARLGGLSSYGRTPDPDDEADARRRLVVARLDREIREQQARLSPAPDPAQMGYLVGLLLMWGRSDGLAVERLERAVREACYVTPNLTDDDRIRIAQLVTEGGER